MFPKMGYAGSVEPRVRKKRLWRNYRVTLRTGRTLSTVKISFHCSNTVSNRWFPWSTIFLSSRLRRYCIIVFILLPANLKSHRVMAALQNVAETKKSMTRWCREEKLSWYQINAKTIHGIPDRMIRKANKPRKYSRQLINSRRRLQIKPNEH